MIVYFNSYTRSASIAKTARVARGQQALFSVQQELIKLSNGQLLTLFEKWIVSFGNSNSLDVKCLVLFFNKIER